MTDVITNADKLACAERELKMGSGPVRFATILFACALPPAILGEVT